MPDTTVRSISAAAALFALTTLGAGPVPQRAVHAQSASIRIDFRAVTADGTPLTTLEPADVSVRIAGKPREITSLELVEATPGEPRPAGPATPAFATNVADAGSGRNILFVIDDDSFEVGREQGLRATLAAIVAGLAPADKVGLFSVRRTGAVNIAPTTNHAAVREAIDNIKGYSGTESTQDFRCRTVVTLQQLQALVSGATGPVPSTFAFFSAAMMQPAEDVANLKFEADADLCRLSPRSFDELSAALAGSRAHVYVAHVGEGTTRTLTEAGQGVESVAGVLGTDTLRVTGNGEAVAQRILGETAAYYMATIAAEPSDKSNAPQRLEVRLEKDGVKVFARPNVSPMRLAGTPAAARRGKTSPRDMIRTSTEFRDLPLRAAGYVSRNQGDDKMRIVVLFEPDGVDTKLTSAMVGLYSAEGKLVAQWSSQDADLASSPARAALAAPKGEYRMRVAAVDASGRSGAVDQTLRADLAEAGSITMSSPLLGPVPASGGFAPKLLFTDKDNAVVSYTELYAVPKGANVTAKLELAPTEDAPALGTTDAQVRPGQSDDHRIIVGGFSIETLEPGDYTVRTVVSIDGQPVGRATTTMRRIGS